MLKEKEGEGSRLLSTEDCAESKDFKNTQDWGRIEEKTSYKSQKLRWGWQKG